MRPIFNERHLGWLKKLIACHSVTPYDDGAQDLIIELVRENFPPIEILSAHGQQTRNTSLTLRGTSTHLVFAGHTDVVPAERRDWSSDPFTLTEDNGFLRGRGVVDMKGAIICFLAALDLVKDQESLPTITIILTSNEEGSGEEGLELIMQQLPYKNPDVIIIGEPTALDQPGDCLKNGRRGSLHARIRLTGQAYHVAYPGMNHPLNFIEGIVKKLKEVDWDKGLRAPFFSPSSFQLTELKTQACVENIIPASLELRFNIRYSPITNLQQCQFILTSTLGEYPLKSVVNWRQGATPWRSTLSKQEIDALFDTHDAYRGVLSTDGGVSDGYKISRYLNSNIVELGLTHHSAHHTDEGCKKEDFSTLTSLYITLLNNLSAR